LLTTGETNVLVLITLKPGPSVAVGVKVAVIGGGACPNPKLKPGTTPHPPINTGIVVEVVANHAGGTFATTL